MHLLKRAIFYQRRGIMINFKRIFVVVLDSVGIGAAPDAAEYNDQGAHTLGHIANHLDGLELPHLGKLGLSNIEEIKGVEKSVTPQAYYTKMEEARSEEHTSELQSRGQL